MAAAETDELDYLNDCNNNAYNYIVIKLDIFVILKLLEYRYIQKRNHTNHT